MTRTKRTATDYKNRKELREKGKEAAPPPRERASGWGGEQRMEKTRARKSGEIVSRWGGEEGPVSKKDERERKKCPGSKR